MRQFASAGQASPLDLTMAETLAETLKSGATVLLTRMAERQVMMLQRDAVLRLARTAAIAAPIEHMLVAGEPLRN